MKIVLQCGWSKENGLSRIELCRGRHSDLQVSPESCWDRACDLRVAHYLDLQSRLCSDPDCGRLLEVQKPASFDGQIRPPCWRPCHWATARKLDGCKGDRKSLDFCPNKFHPKRKARCFSLHLEQFRSLAYHACTGKF